MERIPGLFIAIFIVYLACISEADVSINDCDFKFGDSQWNYSRIYYDRTHVLKAGDQELKITLPHKRGEMISYICVRAPTLGVHGSEASFSPIASTVTLTAHKPVNKDTAVHVIAKIHEY